MVLTRPNTLHATRVQRTSNVTAEPSVMGMICVAGWNAYSFSCACR